MESCGLKENRKGKKNELEKKVMNVDMKEEVASEWKEFEG